MSAADRRHQDAAAAGPDRDLQGNYPLRRDGFAHGRRAGSVEGIDSLRDASYFEVRAEDGIQCGASRGV